MHPKWMVFHCIYISFYSTILNSKQKEVKSNEIQHMLFDQLLPLLFGDDNWLLFSKILSTYAEVDKDKTLPSAP